MAAKAVEETKTEPTLADLIALAQTAEEYAQEKKQAESIARNEATDASNRARDSWNAVHAELLRLKQVNQDSSAFKDSKLGELLRGIR